MYLFKKPPKIKAGALYYTVLISFIITSILSAILLINYFQNRYLDIQLMQDRINRNVKSAIELVMSNPSLVNYNEPVSLDLFDEGMDSVKVCKKRWGGYDLLVSSASWRNYHAQNTALCGIDLLNTDSTALYLADENIYLSVCGETYLNGNCFLPKLGVRRATIEGKFYKNEKEVFGRVTPSKKNLPLAGKGIREFVKTFTTDTLFNSDSIMPISEVRKEQRNISFAREPLVIYSNKALYLKNQEFRGNIIILADEGIRVASTSKLENIILISPRINFDKGFDGSVQAFASDSLVVGDECYLRFPSLVGLVNNNINHVGITIGYNATIAGGVFLFQEYKPPKPSKISIGEESLIFGQVYCNGMVQIMGSIYGSLYCVRIYMQTRAAYYENHLLDATINFMDIPKNFVGYNLFNDKNNNMEIIEWLD